MRQRELAATRAFWQARKRTYEATRKKAAPESLGYTYCTTTILHCEKKLAELQGEENHAKSAGRGA